MSISSRVTQPALAKPSISALLESPRNHFLAGAALIVGLVFWIYWPALHGGFIWDDELLISSNKLVLSSDGLFRIWFTRDPVDYWPVTNSIFWLEWRAWHTNTTGYHVLNDLLHIGNALLAWMILRRLSIPGSFLAALLFAVHPINVESAAWIAQLKNMLSLLFCLLSLACYLQARAAISKRGYWLSLLMFTLAMLSKGSVAVLPLVLLVLRWWQQRRFTRADLLRIVPFFAVAIVFTLVDIWFQKHGSSEIIRNVTSLQRLLGAGAVVWFYLYKTLLPIDLAFVYPQWNIQPGNWLWWLPLAVTLTVTVLLCWQRNRNWVHPLFVAWMIYCLGLLPVMGFVDVYFMKFSLVADHYEYTSIIVVTALIAAVWQLICSKAGAAVQLALLLLAVIVIASFSAIARQQSALYADSLTLYRAALDKNPSSALLQDNYGTQVFLAGNIQESLEHFQSAVNLEPNNAEAVHNLGLAQANLGQTEQAIANYRRALNMRPDLSQAHNSLGLELAKQGKTAEAIAEFREAVRINYFYPQAYYDLANTLEQIGKLPEAIDNYRFALQYDPEYLVAHNALAAALMKAGQPAAAVSHYQESLQLNPDSPEIENNFATALIQVGQPQQAIAHLRQALQLKPDYPAAQHNLGLALANSGQFDQAIPCYEAALRLQPNFPAAENNLGSALRETGQPQAALKHYQAALEQNPDYCQAYANMAVTYAQLNRPTEALAAAQKGLEIAQSHGQADLAKQIETWLTNYHAGQGTPSSPSH